MKHFIKYAGLMLSGTLASGTASAFWNKHGNGFIETRTFHLSEFDATKVEGEAFLEIKIGEPSVAVSMDSNLFESLDVDVKNRRLEVKTSWRAKPTSRPRVVVTLPLIKKIELDGNVESQVTLGAQDKGLDIETHGSSQINVTNAQLDHLVIEANGASIIEVKGRTQDFDIESAGNFRGEFEELDIVKAKVEGAGSTTLRFGKVTSISGELSGVNSITYIEPPKQSTLKSH